MGCTDPLDPVHYGPCMRTANPTPGNDQSAEVLEELLNSWPAFSAATADFHQPAARRGKRFENPDVARIATVIGLSRHVYDTVEAANLLIQSERDNAAIPLVRMAYETALTAVWLVQSKGHHGITAFMREYSRSRKALQQDAAKATSAAFREGAASVADADPDLYPEEIDSVQRFRQVCLDLTPGGADAYVIYRVLSAYSHSSLSAAELYIAKHESGVPGRRDRPDRALSRALLQYLMACSLVWAGRAFSYLSHDKAHRSVLRQAARRLGITSELQLGPNYHQRHAKSGARRNG